MWIHRTLGVFMGSVIVTFRIMPEGVDTDLGSVENKLKERINPQRIEKIPIAFGLNSLRVIKLVEEKEGEMDRITEQIKSIEGVREVEVTNVTRSL